MNLLRSSTTSPWTSTKPSVTKNRDAILSRSLDSIPNKRAAPSSLQNALRGPLVTSPTSALMSTTRASARAPAHQCHCRRRLRRRLRRQRPRRRRRLRRRRSRRRPHRLWRRLLHRRQRRRQRRWWRRLRYRLRHRRHRRRRRQLRRRFRHQRYRRRLQLLNASTSAPVARSVRPWGTRLWASVACMRAKLSATRWRVARRSRSRKQVSATFKTFAS
mmetsp:Transcript_79371/g.219509  ORF Transcript_79371/g.219509 Transcript_79371/m.219509 type:complete len:217 (+) Transcript_79371:393-1043(+)